MDQRSFGAACLGLYPGWTDGIIHENRQHATYTAPMTHESTKQGDHAAPMRYESTKQGYHAAVTGWQNSKVVIFAAQIQYYREMFSTIFFVCKTQDQRS